jgi:hypothetical protein
MIARSASTSVVTLMALTGVLCAAPLPPLGKITITGTITQATWVPRATLKGRKGMSGSLGRERVIPAHFVVKLGDYSGPSVRQAWMLNGFMNVSTSGTEDRSKPPAALVVWVNSEDSKALKDGMRIRLVNYTVTGDEGGTWTAIDRMDVLQSVDGTGAKQTRDAR